MIKPAYRIDIPWHVEDILECLFFYAAFSLGRMKRKLRQHEVRLVYNVVLEHVPANERLSEMLIDDFLETKKPEINSGLHM